MQKRNLRYVDVIQFVYHVLQLLLIRIRERNLCCISKSTMKHQSNLNRKLDLPLFSVDYQDCAFIYLFIC